MTAAATQPREIECVVAPCADCGRIEPVTQMHPEDSFCMLCISIPNWYMDPLLREHFAPGWVPPERIEEPPSKEEMEIETYRAAYEIKKAVATPMELPPDLWRDQTVYIVGGGPSVKEFDLERLRGKIVIALNSSYLGCSGMGATLLFIDDGWAFTRHKVIENWDGLVVTTARAAKMRWIRRIYLADQYRQPQFIVGEWPRILYGRSCGHVGISLAVALQAKRIVLLGYDMRKIEGRSHWHSDYDWETLSTLFEFNFIPAFFGWQKMAEKVGVEIINATPDSALDEFPKASIDALL